jgi:conflict system STAND superfamily ATPase
VRRLAGRRFLAVVGTSGSGKSSLVRAGLLPSLEGGFMAEAGAHWRMAILRPQDDPIGFLARAIVETGALAHLDLAQSAAEGVVETTLRRSGLGLVEATRLARLEPHENLLILVDQFEELFRFADLARQRGAGDEAPAFVKLLLEAARQTEVPVYVVITMRSDFLGDCARFRDLPEAINDSQYLIPCLTCDELRAVITDPIGVRVGRIAPSLVQRLLNDVGDDMDQLPVLQHALMRAWDHWERGDPDLHAIELSDLEAIGGMAEALSRDADEAFGSLATDRDRKIAERLFKCLTERGSDNRELRRPTPLSRIAEIANAYVTSRPSRTP